MFTGAMIGLLVLTTQQIQGAFRFTAAQARLGFLPITLMTLLASFHLPRLSRQPDIGRARVLAFSCAAVALFWLSFAGAARGWLTQVALPMRLPGRWNGTVLGPWTITGVQDVASQVVGATSGVVNVAHQPGHSLGGAGLAAEAATEGGLSAGLLTAAGFQVIGRAAAILVIVRPCLILGESA